MTTNTTATRYNRSAIFSKAWAIFRKEESITFGEALHRAWESAKAAPVNNARVEAAKAEAGVVEECHTWSEWKNLGFEVIHGSKALFGAELIWASKGSDKVYKARFFGASQVQPIAA